MEPWKAAMVKLLNLPETIIKKIMQSMAESWKEHSPGITLSLSQKKQRVFITYHRSLLSLYLGLQMSSLVAGAFQIRGPHEPVVAMLGGEAELPCFLTPSQNAKYMRISWSRSMSSQVVHVYKDGRDHPEGVMEQYSGRTKLMKDAISKGIVVLRILNVQTSDNGLYRCGFQHGSFYNDTLIELKVAVLGSDPHFHVEVTKSREILLECKSEGWFPLPKIQWINSWGEQIPSVSESQTQNKGGLFHVSASLLLKDPSPKNMTCSVWNPVLNQKKEEQISIAVAEPSGSWFTPFIILAVILVVLVLTIIVFRIRKRR
ncbi:butyrophilin subfamily 1 member A1-like isoform X3 [Castor canadensis]|uniref:Butyrophilin subfamily 1 member A1-like isoform X3 n=1 Tax=Castor canadensis TaxID=51338 RepID=A0AC58N8A0_CASCN